MKRFIFLIVLAVLALAPAAFAHDAEYDQIAAEAQLGKQQVADLTSKLFVYKLAVKKVEAGYEARIAAEKKNTAAANKRADAEHTQVVKLTNEKAAHKNDWLGPRAHGLIFWISVLTIAAIVCKVLGQIIPGGLGAVLSWIGEGLLAIATLGISTISTLFNNLWFRFGAQGKSVVASFIGWLKSFFSHKTPAAPVTST